MRPDYWLKLTQHDGSKVMVGLSDIYFIKQTRVNGCDVVLRKKGVVLRVKDTIEDIDAVFTQIAEEFFTKLPKVPKDEGSSSDRNL